MTLFDLDRWLEIAQTMSRSKLRTGLTMFGVGWGMFMLLLMLGFGDGLERGVERKFGGDATNSVFLWGQRTSLPYQGHRAGRRVRFHNADTDAIAATIQGIEHLAPRNQLGGYQGGTNVTHDGKTGSYQVMGDTPQYRYIQPMIFDAGRFIDPLDEAEHRKVAVIGRGVYRELYTPGADPIGSTLQIRGVWFRVIGMIHSPNSGDEGDSADTTVHVPFSTFQRAFNSGDEVRWYALTGRPQVSAETLEEDVSKLLASRCGVHPEDEDAIGSFNAAEEFAKITNLFMGIRLFVWFVGTATLLSGVVGVSNIMLIVVKERTREIGIRRAIGAPASSVIGQVMQESIVLTLVAGYAGLVAGVAVLESMAVLVGEDNEVIGNPQVDFRVALAAAVVLTATGALAGIIPAQRAASVRPVEALRAE
jgi:putative ABC transport system permease protein